MIEKPSILVTSIGRTGTEFFARLFGEIVPNSTSLHEPDVIKFVGVESNLRHLLRQVQIAGVWRLFILKALGKWSIVKLSDLRLRGKLSHEDAVDALQKQRGDFVRKAPGSTYIESNLGYYGLLDITPSVFCQHRVIYVVRDGRDWVRSMLDWNILYRPDPPTKSIGHEWPAATDIPGNPYLDAWSRFSRFEKLCWAWATLNTYAIASISKNQDARLFHFEHIFSGPQKYESLKELVHFATDLPGLVPRSIGKTDGWLERKTHGSSGQSPVPEAWTAVQKRQFAEICGPLMERLGYDLGQPRPERT